MTVPPLNFSLFVYLQYSDNTQEASVLLPRSASSLLKLPPPSSQRMDESSGGCCTCEAKWVLLGGVKHSQWVPANDKCFMLVFWRSGCRWDIPVPREEKKHKDGCVLVFPLPPVSFFCFRVGRAPVTCVFSPSWLLRDLRVRSADVSDGRSRVRIRRFRGRKGHSGGALAAEGQLGQRHGLVRETLRGQHREGMTWRAHKEQNNDKKIPVFK